MRLSTIAGSHVFNGLNFLKPVANVAIKNRSFFNEVAKLLLKNTCQLFSFLLCRVECLLIGKDEDRHKRLIRSFDRDNQFDFGKNLSETQ